MSQPCHDDIQGTLVGDVIEIPEWKIEQHLNDVCAALERQISESAPSPRVFDEGEHDCGKRF